MSTTAEKVRAAADYIDRTGLHKGSMVKRPSPHVVYLSAFEYPEKVVSLGLPCCTIGALEVHGVNTDEVRIPLSKRLGIYESYTDLDWNETVVEDHIPDWNDAPERTKEDVVTALRELADELEQGASLTE